MTSENAAQSTEAAEGIEPSWRALQALASGRSAAGQSISEAQPSPRRDHHVTTPGYVAEHDGTLSALPYHTIVNVPGLHLVHGPGTLGNALMARHVARIRRTARREGRRIHTSTTGTGAVIVSVR